MSAGVAATEDIPASGSLKARTALMRTKSNSDADLLRIWKRAWPALPRQLKQLRSLRIRLDHSGSSSWSVVDERAVLSLLIEAVSTETIPSLKHIFLELPSHDWRLEQHYSEKSPAPPAIVTIDRRLRQRYHSKESVPGQYMVHYEASRPLLWDIHEFGHVEARDLHEFERYMIEHPEIDPYDYCL